jgi:hypothetical protein
MIHQSPSEDERHLFYMVMTRALTNIFVGYANKLCRAVITAGTINNY